MLDKENITHEGLIAKQFNTCFGQSETNLTKTIETSSIEFESFLKKYDSILPESPLSVNELKDAFFHLKSIKFLAMITFNKNVLFDRIEHEYLFYCSNLVVNSCFSISNPHKYHI